MNCFGLKVGDVFRSTINEEMMTLLDEMTMCDCDTCGVDPNTAVYLMRVFRLGEVTTLGYAPQDELVPVS